MNGGYTFTETIVVLLIICIAIPLYFLPFIIASKRKLSQTHTIGFLKFFLGITTVGWVILVIFAALARGPSDQSGVLEGLRANAP